LYQHGAEHGERQRKTATVADQIGGLWRQILRHEPGPACKGAPGLLGGEQVGGVFDRAGGGGDGAVARGEEQPRTGRLGEEGFDIGGAPDIVHDYQGRFRLEKRAVAIDALEFGLVGIGLISEGAADLLEADGEIAGDIFAHGGPGDAIGERLLHDGIVDQSPREDRLADAAHATQSGEGDGGTGIVGNYAVAEAFESLGPWNEVAGQRRGGDISGAELPLQCDGVAAGADVLAELAQLRWIECDGGEVPIVCGFEVQGYLGIGRGEERNHPLAKAEGTELFGAADIGDVGGGRHQGEQDVAAVDLLFDFEGPGGAGFEAGGVEPDVVVGVKAGLKVGGEAGSVLAGV
jgi:hypothetical protein